MSEQDSFIEEVAEEVRRDQLFNYLRRYLWVIVAALVLILGGAAANEWWKASQRAAAQAAGDGLLAATAPGDPQARLAALEPLVAEGGGPALVARFQRAGAALEANDTELAANELRAIAADGDTPPLYQDLARLQMVMAAGDTLESTEKAGIFAALISGQGSFIGLALEQRALDHLANGRRDEAVADLSTILRDPTTAGGLRVRAQQMMEALGETPPEPQAMATNG